MLRAILLSAVATAGLFILPAGGEPAAYATREALGEALFFDTALSANRTLACASCHDPEAAFTDPRETPLGRAVSGGDDGVSLGVRNAPSAAYAALAPPFHRRPDGTFAGGQFWDGRAADLAVQAEGPPVNPVEMAMPDRASVVARLGENPAYVAAFDALFGADILTDPHAGYIAMTEALAAFEATALFQPFDSKYDRALRGEYTFTRQEELGRTLFFSRQFTNCNLCHQLDASPVAPHEPFTNFQYRNIGVPPNPVLGVAADRGLGAMTGDVAQDGMFKVPSLRNVAVTGPYMHNGVFADLRTVILFYNKYNAKAAARQVNPETGADWGRPEVAENLALQELETGPALDDRRVDAIVAFLRTLTDARYEPLIAAAAAAATAPE